MTYLVNHPILILLGWMLLAFLAAALWIGFAALFLTSTEDEEELRELEEAFQWPEKQRGRR